MWRRDRDSLKVVHDDNEHVSTNQKMEEKEEKEEKEETEENERRKRK